MVLVAAKFWGLPASQQRIWRVRLDSNFSTTHETDSSFNAHFTDEETEVQCGYLLKVGDMTRLSHPSELWQEISHFAKWLSTIKFWNSKDAQG
jgi:hypothetical protein